MSIRIKGTEFIYEIDKKDFPDGFIAQGTESFVFKGRKISLKGDNESDLSFSCVLKFKPYSPARFRRFTNNELRIFEELQECRSVARIYDVIEDLGSDFDLKTPQIKKHIRSKGVSPSAENIPCFCVVEEYIDGWSLEQYCIRQFWGLEKEKNNRWIGFHEFSDLEKEEVLRRYKDEKTFFSYQHKLLHYMQSLCGILQFISSTSKRKVLHLDIKPENIMVTSQSEELVLIDFGRSEFLEDGQQFIYHDLEPVIYRKFDGSVTAEDINLPFCHGTIGYAAPEAFAAAVNNDMPFRTDGIEIGKMSIESDIFSFGATFWECLNIVELVTNSESFSGAVHKSSFYEKYLLNDEAYFDRDLSLECTGPLGGRYHASLQSIISKCTKRRTKGYLEKKNTAYYHDYDEIMRDLEDARDSIPTVKKGENKQVRNAAVILGICIGCFLSLSMVSGIYRMIGARIAEGSWKELTADIITHGSDSAYQTTKEGKLSQIAAERMELANSAQKLTVCGETFDFLSRDSLISSSETNIMISLLDRLDSDEDKIRWVDSIMEQANPVELPSIVAGINTLGLSTDDLGCNLAIALYCVDRETDYDYADAFDLIEQHADSGKYRTALKMLAVTLNNKGGYVVDQIAESRGMTRSEVVEILNRVEGS